MTTVRLYKGQGPLEKHHDEYCHLTAGSKNESSNMRMSQTSILGRDTAKVSGTKLVSERRKVKGKGGEKHIVCCVSDLQAEQVSVLSLLVSGRQLQQTNETAQVRQVSQEKQKACGTSTRPGLQQLETEAVLESLSQRISGTETDSVASLSDSG